MNAMEFFVYTASVGIIILLILLSIGFYLFYRTLLAAQSFMKAAEGMITEIQLVKTGAALTALKFMRTILQKIRGGGE